MDNITLWVVSFVIITAAITIIYIAVSFSKINKKETEQYENAQRNWDMRAKELGFSPTGKSVVYRKYGNSDGFYPAYVWKENGKLMYFRAEPTKSTCSSSYYTYPENICLAHFGDIKRIYRTGSKGERIEHDMSHSDGLEKRADMTTGIESLYYRKKALDAAKHAPSYTVEYDTRKTIVEQYNGVTFEFRIDAYDVFKELVPDKC